MLQSIFKRSIVIEDSKIVPCRPNSSVPVIEYALSKHFCAKLELITYGNTNHHNTGVSFYNNCGINQLGEMCPDRIERDGFRNHFSDGNLDSKTFNFTIICTYFPFGFIGTEWLVKVDHHTQRHVS